MANDARRCLERLVKRDCSRLRATVPRVSDIVSRVRGSLPFHARLTDTHKHTNIHSQVHTLLTRYTTTRRSLTTHFSCLAGRFVGRRLILSSFPASGKSCHEFNSARAIEETFPSWQTTSLKLPRLLQAGGNTANLVSRATKISTFLRGSA